MVICRLHTPSSLLLLFILTVRAPSLIPRPLPRFGHLLYKKQQRLGPGLGMRLEGNMLIKSSNRAGASLALIPQWPATICMYSLATLTLQRAFSLAVDLFSYVGHLARTLKNSAFATLTSGVKGHCSSHSSSAVG